jgi:hypothetical protein
MANHCEGSETVSTQALWTTKHSQGCQQEEELNFVKHITTLK